MPRAPTWQLGGDDWWIPDSPSKHTNDRAARSRPLAAMLNVDVGAMIVRCTSIEQPGWLRLRQALWPECPLDRHLAEMSSFVAKPERFAQFVVYAETRGAVGLVEASIRSDYVNGTRSSPVAFLEGIYVITEARRKGVATASIWAKSLGCCELASDALLENTLSHAFHRALGFEETERVVFFRRPLA